MRKIEQEAEEDVMKNEVDIFIAKMKMEIVINKSLCGEVEFLRFCFFFAFEIKMIKISFKNFRDFNFIEKDNLSDLFFYI